MKTITQVQKENVANRNAIQKKYSEFKKEALELTSRISRSVIDLPAAGNTWADVSEAEYLVEQLREITDRLYSEGEYAKQ